MIYREKKNCRLYTDSCTLKNKHLKYAIFLNLKKNSPGVFLGIMSGNMPSNNGSYTAKTLKV